MEGEEGEGGHGVEELLEVIVEERRGRELFHLGDVTTWNQNQTDRQTVEHGGERGPRKRGTTFFFLGGGGEEGNDGDGDAHAPEIYIPCHRFLRRGR